MKRSIQITLVFSLLISIACIGEELTKTQIKINSRLDNLQATAEQVLGGQAKIIDGLRNLDAKLQTTGCEALAGSSGKASKKMTKDYKWLKKKHSKMTESQVERFSAIEPTVKEAQAGINCKELFAGN